MTALTADMFAEAKFLIDNPHFQEKPATIAQFLGEGYLGIEKRVRPGIRQALEEIFGDEVDGQRIAQFERAMVTGGIGIGKTTFASIALPYMAHWCLCLTDPQDFFDLLPGSRIAFMQMSTSEQNAREVIFGDIQARIKTSPWFKTKYPYDSNFTKQIKFPQKDIWILPGDSSETTFEGYNILAGILDEMDSHKITQKKDYADVGFDTIESRISSRFTVEDTSGGAVGHRGLIVCIGQMKKSTGFAQRKYEEFKADPKAHVTRMTIWESLGWGRYTNKDTGERLSFYYDIKRKKILPRGIAQLLEANTEGMIEVPNAYLKQFETNPEKALRDLAGIPPKVSDPFISLEDRVESCSERWVLRYPDMPDGPVGDALTYPNLDPDFRALDRRRRTVHIDMATSGDGDALGFAMGHVEELVKVDDEEKPYIVMDMVARVKAHPGGEIMISDIRRLIYYLRDDLGFRITQVTMDGFQSTDTLQQLRRKRFIADYLSVDKTTLPYEDLREAIYEKRIEFPPFFTYISHGDAKRVQILPRELLTLQDTGKKIDHPADGSKDVADAVAGVTYTLIGDRTFRKGVRSTTDAEAEATVSSQANQFGQLGFTYLGVPEGFGLTAPKIPDGSVAGLAVPNRLRARER